MCKNIDLFNYPLSPLLQKVGRLFLGTKYEYAQPLIYFVLERVICYEVPKR